MEPRLGILAEQLKGTCKQSGARWAVWLFRGGKGWDFVLEHAVSKTRHNSLLEFIHLPEISTWLGGAFSSGRTRSRNCGEYQVALGIERVYVFANAAEKTALLIGANGLSGDSQAFFRVLSLARLREPRFKVSDDQIDQSLDDDGAAASDPKSALDRLLGMVVRELPARAGYLATRSGDSYRIATVVNYPVDLVGSDIQIQEEQSLSEMEQSRRGVLLSDAHTAPSFTFPDFAARPVRSTIAAPIMLGRRMIGIAVLVSFRVSGFRAADLRQMERLAVGIAPSVENFVLSEDNARLHREKSVNASKLNLFHKLIQRVVGLSDLHEIAQVTADLLGEYFQYEFVTILVPDEAGRNLVNLGIGGTKAETLPRGIQVPVTKGITGKVFRTGRAYVCNDISRDPDFIAIEEWAAGSEICVPLFENERVIGVLNLERSEKYAFGEQDQVLLESFAGIISSVMTSARRQKELQAKIGHLQAARATMMDMTSALDLTVLFRRLVRRVIELIDARGAAVGLVDEDDRVVRMTVLEYPGLAQQSLVIPFGVGVVGRVAATGQSQNIPNYRNWIGRIEIMSNDKITAVAGIPLIWRDQVVGVLIAVDDRADRVFQPAEIELLELLAPQVAVSIRNAYLYKELNDRVAQQQNVEKRLLHSAKLAALGEMATGIAHELNNPLTTVSGFVELALQELPADIPQREELELVLAESHRARAVIRRLLEYSRLNEKVRLPTHINDLVNQVVNLIQHQAQTIGVDIQLQLCEELPQVMIYPDAIQQVLVNLTNNSLQAMPAGGKLILTTKLAQQADREWITIAVQDSGYGIPAENLEFVFEPFFTTRPLGKGTGLGLAVSMRLVEEHSGTIEVESKIDEGSCFTVWLPLESVLNIA